MVSLPKFKIGDIVEFYCDDVAYGCFPHSKTKFLVPTNHPGRITGWAKSSKQEGAMYIVEFTMNNHAAIGSKGILVADLKEEQIKKYVQR
jgi:hypothetical protein